MVFRYGYGLQGKGKHGQQVQGTQCERCTRPTHQRGRFFSLQGFGVQIEIVQSMAVHGLAFSGYGLQGLNKIASFIEPNGFADNTASVFPFDLFTANGFGFPVKSHGDGFLCAISQDDGDLVHSVPLVGESCGNQTGHGHNVPLGAVRCCGAQDLDSLARLLLGCSHGDDVGVTVHRCARQCGKACKDAFELGSAQGCRE